MTARITTIAFQGIDCVDVEVQVQLSAGLPAFTIVGLADKAVTESRERVRAALTAIGLALPPKRITVNLSPADLVKEGSHYDLPIALALLVALGAVPSEDVGNLIVLGELALDGSLTPVTGVLPAAFRAATSGRGILCPAACGGEAAWADGVEVLAPPSLLALVNHLRGQQILTPPEPHLGEEIGGGPDLADIKGQETAKRALEIAAAGGHNLLMIGPPGSGKSMLAARLPGLLPPLAPEEALDVAMIHSLAGLLTEQGLQRRRPFRDPHHSATPAALIGGGPRSRPGEISLAHRGVLFLDELPEFPRAALEALRQPLETGRAVIARARGHVSYPARVQLVAAMNPCRCGQPDDPAFACGRAPKCLLDYQGKLSGPLLDRIDLHVDVPALSAADLSRPPPGESTAIVAARVAAARQRQLQRFAALKADGVRCNAEADGPVLTAIATPDAEGQKLLTQAADTLRLSARGWHRVLRVARTLADLAGAEGIGRPHIAEALAYRRLAPTR